MLENSNHEKPAGEVRKASIVMRCRRADKAKWTAAAKAAVKTGQIAADGRGTLAPWVVKTLNDAAAKAGRSSRSA